MKILVPVDGSPHSMEALQVAADMAKEKGAEILVISVVPYIGGMEDHEISPSRRERHMESIGKLAEEAVKKACEVLAAKAVTTGCLKPVVATSSVPDAIVDFASEEGVGLIVMGSRGLSSLGPFKLGSVASQVVKMSTCSVYIVKTPAEAAA